MQISDAFYGTFEVDEPVLVELIDSAPVQRLKGIEQLGMPKELYRFPGFSRYEHSIGVMLLVRKLGATVEEQAAALLHDVSHTAFSHVADWVLGNQANEDYHDKQRSIILGNSEIPQILSRFGFDFEKVIDSDRYPLLKRRVPSLCADRFDYALREFSGWANPDIVEPCIDNVAVYGGILVFKNKKVAQSFGRTFLKLQSEHWGSADAVLRYHIFSQALKIALSEKTITADDFLKDDDFIMEKLRASTNPQIKRALQALSGKLNFELAEKNSQLHLKKKFRHVDPEYLDNGLPRRLSTTDAEFRALLEEQKKSNEKGINVNLWL